MFYLTFQRDTGTLCKYKWSWGFSDRSSVQALKLTQASSLDWTYRGLWQQYKYRIYHFSNQRYTFWIQCPYCKTFHNGMWQYHDAICALFDRSFSVEYYSLSCVFGRIEPDCVSTHYTVGMRTEVCSATLVHRSRLWPDYQSVLPFKHRGWPRGRRDDV